MVLTPPAVALLGKGVALRAASEDDKGRYRLREQSNGTSLVDGRRFCAHHDLGVDKATKFDAESLGDGIVGFRLPESAVDDEGKGEKGESPKTKGSRGGKRKSAA